MKKGIGLWVVVAFVVVFAAVMIVSTTGLASHRVEVCMEFEGRSACRTAAGATEEEARSTALQNACALISSGVSGTVRCQNTAPVKVTVLGEK